MGDALPAVSLGDQKPVAVAAGYSDTCAIFEDGSLKCWGLNARGELGQGDGLWHGHLANDMGAALHPINLGTGRKVLKVKVGIYRVCALLDDSTVKCWGYNAFGALGDGDTLDRGSKPEDMGDALPAVDFGGEPVLDLAGGFSHNCVMLPSGVKCWGWNLYGQLGLGDTLDRGASPSQLGEQLGLVDLGSF